MPVNGCESCMFDTYGHCIVKANEKDYNKRADENWCPLKPMPLKRETHVYWKSVGIGNIPTHEISDYDKGWNDCVEFMEGDDNG